MGTSTKPGETEKRMLELLKECEDIVDDSYLTTQDARRILDMSYKVLQLSERLRESRDNWRNKYETSSAYIENNTHRKKDKDDGSNVSLSGDTKQIRRKNNKDEHMSVDATHLSNIVDTHGEIKLNSCTNY